MLRRSLTLATLLLLPRVVPSHAAETVVTAFVEPAPGAVSPAAEATKRALRRLLVSEGVDRQIQAAARQGRNKARYFLKIAHNNGAGVDGFAVAKTQWMPGYVGAITKTVMKYLRETRQEALSPEEQEIVRDGSERLDAIAREEGTAPPADGASGDRSGAESAGAGATSAAGRSATGVKLFGKSMKLLLARFTRATRTASWDVIGYPSVSNPVVAMAWAELVREWGGEPWIGDESGIESPATYQNMVASGFVEAARKSGARLWIFTKGVVDPSSTPGEPKYLAVVDGEKLDAFEPITSDDLADYPQRQIRIPRPIVDGFFAGVFFEAHPKSHTLSGISSAIKNMVGLMDRASRYHMHNLPTEKSPWGIVTSHSTASDKKIAQTARAVTRALGPKIVGYIGDSFSTITAVGPDSGPHTVFKPEDWTITFSRSLLGQETATLSITMAAARRVMATGSRYPKLQFNRYFHTGNPLADGIYGYFSSMTLAGEPGPHPILWKLLGADPAPALVADLKAMLPTYLAKLAITLSTER